MKNTEFLNGYKEQNHHFQIYFFQK